MRLNTIPNWISIGRFLLGIGIIVAMEMNLEIGAFWLVATYGLVLGLDKVDGLVARKFNQVTRTGVYLDWALDRALVLIMIMFYWYQGGGSGMLWWLIVIGIIRDSLLSGMRQLALEKNVKLKTQLIGKFKYILENVGIMLMILELKTNNTYGDWLIIIWMGATVLGLISLLNYAKQWKSEK